MENGDERAKVSTALGRIFHVFDAIASVGMNDFFTERFQGVPGGDDLVENIRAIRILRDQSFKRLNLAPDLAEPKNEGVLFALRVDVFHG
jgi:hypothetical protein